MAIRLGKDLVRATKGVNTRTYRYALENPVQQIVIDMAPYGDGICDGDIATLVVATVRTDNSLGWTVTFYDSDGNAVTFATGMASHIQNYQPGPTYQTICDLTEFRISVLSGNVMVGTKCIASIYPFGQITAGSDVKSGTDILVGVTEKPITKIAITAKDSLNTGSEVLLHIEGVGYNG